jgi:hypothetical protein
MELFEIINPYFMPTTTGFQSTTTQNVFQPIRTTAGQMIIPLRVVDLQRDLDRQPEGESLAFINEMLCARRVPALPDRKDRGTQSKPDSAGRDFAEGGEEVVIDTHRVLTAERAFREWQQMTEPAGPGVQLPPDIED